MRPDLGIVTYVTLIVDLRAAQNPRHPEPGPVDGRTSPDRHFVLDGHSADLWEVFQTTIRRADESETGSADDRIRTDDAIPSDDGSGMDHSPGMKNGPVAQPYLRSDEAERSDGHVCTENSGRVNPR
jgi:hypothetical protein